MIIPWTFSSAFLFASKWSILRSAEKIGLRHKEVLLTFDDGPNGFLDITDRLLDILKDEHIPGTFCVIGNRAQKHPDVIRRIYWEGHTLAFHGMYHTVPWWPSRQKILQEFALFTETMRHIIRCSQYECLYYRPPYGLIFPRTEKALEMREKRLVPITFYQHDADALPCEADDVIEGILLKIRQEQRAAIVIHECREEKYIQPNLTQNSQDARNKHWVPQKIHLLIKRLKQENYTFIGMSELTSRTKETIHSPFL